MNLKLKSINISVLGHVDHGKSTLTVRLLHATGSIPSATLEKYKKQALAMGKQSFYLAWGMDTLAEQRRRGVTIDYNQKQFKTDHVNFTIVDCPGHSDYIKNAIAGSAQTQAAILVVAGDTSEEKIPLPAQTKEHAYVLATHGISRVIVVINKCDLYKTQANFTRKKLQVKKLIDMLFGTTRTEYIPASGLTGDNVSKGIRPAYLSWYTGKSLIEALNELRDMSVEQDKPPIFVISQVLRNVKGAGTVITGVGYTGVIEKNVKYLVKPLNKQVEVKSIEKFHKSLDIAQPFESVGMVLRGVQGKDLKKGHLICDLNKHPKAVKHFIATIKVFAHPTSVWLHSELIVHMNTNHVTCRVDEIFEVKSFKKDQNGKRRLMVQLEQDGSVPKRVDNRCVARVKLTPKKKLIISTMAENSKFARFQMRDSNKTIGIGECIEAIPLDSQIGIAPAKKIK